MRYSVDLRSAFDSNHMDGLRQFLEAIRQAQLVQGYLRAILHIAIGRKISRTDGTVLSAGTTWRQLSELDNLT